MKYIRLIYIVSDKDSNIEAQVEGGQPEIVESNEDQNAKEKGDENLDESQVITEPEPVEPFSNLGPTILPVGVSFYKRYRKKYCLISI